MPFVFGAALVRR